MNKISKEILSKEFPDSVLLEKMELIPLFNKACFSVEKQCKIYLNYIKNNSLMLYRGSKKIKDLIAVKKPRVDRKPVDTPLKIDRFVENYRKIYFNDVPSRKESIFTTPMYKNNEVDSNAYGFLFLVFPTDDLKIFQNLEPFGGDFYINPKETNIELFFEGSKKVIPWANSFFSTNKLNFNQDQYEILRKSIEITKNVIDTQHCPLPEEKEILIELFEHVLSLKEVYKKHKNVNEIKSAISLISDLLDIMEEMEKYYKESANNLNQIVKQKEVIIKAKRFFLFNKMLQREVFYALNIDGQF